MQFKIINNQLVNQSQTELNSLACNQINQPIYHLYHRDYSATEKRDQKYPKLCAAVNFGFNLNCTQLKSPITNLTA